MFLIPREELNELKSALEHGSDSEKEEELGDVIFSLVNYSRLLGFNADTALERTNLKFMKRFLWMEEKAALNDKKLSDYKLNELETLWQEAKKH